MAVFSDRSSDTTHVSHPTLVVGTQYLGRFNNFNDPTFGFTTDFDFLEVDLSGVPKGAKLQFTFLPSDAYFYRVIGRVDDYNVLHGTTFFPGGTTFINHDPLTSDVNGNGKVTWTVPDLSQYDHPILELQIRGGDNPGGGLLYTPLDYTINFGASIVSFNGTETHSDFFDTHTMSLRQVTKAKFNNDFVWSGQANDLIYGGQGRDILIGDNGNDTIYGDDSPTSAGNNDQLLGGGGNDTLRAGVGKDYLNGEWGNDKLYGDAGNDLMYGGFGNDKLFGGTGNDILYGGSTAKPNGAWFGKPIVLTWNGVTDQAMGAQAWTIAGEAQHTDASGDYLDGGAGADKLFGQAGNDKMLGGTGNDFLNGGLGRDILVGGADQDTFKYGYVSESRGAGRDVITDFKHGVDKLDVSSIDADTTESGNQVFVYLGAKPFRGNPGEIRWDGTVVEADVNGDQATDFSIGLRNVTTLSRLDFIL
jgi:Ca2+-binding RTX toxin-like protein